MAKKKKYYVVWVGQKPGVYDSWDKCLLQTKGFPNAKYKSFKTLKEAKNAFSESALKHIQSSGEKNKKKSADLSRFKHLINYDSICVDAACSGNPGIMEYRGVITESKEELFLSRKYNGGTNNLGEFLAIVHGLAFLHKEGKTNMPIYTDSRTAMAWIRNRKIKTTLQPTKNNSMLFTHLERAKAWLNNHSFKNEILKWDTKNWGEIPADFGRK